MKFKKKITIFHHLKLNLDRFQQQQQPHFGTKQQPQQYFNYLLLLYVIRTEM